MDASALSKSASVNENEHHLGTSVSHTTKLNIAHVVDDEDDEAPKQTTEHLHGIHTTNFNIAHIIHDKDDEVLKQAVKHLEADLPSDAEIREIQADIAKLDAKGGGMKRKAGSGAAGIQSTNLDFHIDIR